MMIVTAQIVNTQIRILLIVTEQNANMLIKCARITIVSNKSRQNESVRNAVARSKKLVIASSLKVIVKIDSRANELGKYQPKHFNSQMVNICILMLNSIPVFQKMSSYDGYNVWMKMILRVTQMQINAWVIKFRV